MQNVPMVKANQPQTTNPSLQTTLTVPVNAVPLIESTIKTYQNDQPEIDLIMRLPEGHTKEHPTAKGVLAFCTWQRSKEALRATLQSETNPLVQYAMRNHLALLTWNTAILWKTLKKGERVDLFKNAQLERAFDSVATSWRVGVEQLCKEQNIPATGVLLDGFSAGAHWSERLALRHPSMFLAVHLHVANNYEQISDNAVGPLWAVSSGDLDVGRNSTVNFYRECQSRGFPIILKVSNGLGHASNSEIEKFRDAFFDYALDVAKRPGRKSPASMMLEDLNSANLVGDFLSQEVYHNSSVSQVPVSQRVPLPDVQVAKAWGYLRK